MATVHFAGKSFEQISLLTFSHLLFKKGGRRSIAKSGPQRGETSKVRKEGFSS